MIDLLAIYICPKCGEVLEDEIETVEEIDSYRDEVYIIKLHNKCNSEASPKLVDGHQHFKQVDHERWLWATGFYDDTEKEEVF